MCLQSIQTGFGIRRLPLAQSFVKSQSRLPVRGKSSQDSGVPQKNRKTPLHFDENRSASLVKTQKSFSSHIRIICVVVNSHVKVHRPLVPSWQAVQELLTFVFEWYYNCKTSIDGCNLMLAMGSHSVAVPVVELWLDSWTSYWCFKQCASERWTEKGRGTPFDFAI